MTDVAQAGVPSDPTVSPPADPTSTSEHTDHDIDMCRVCRTESTPNRPLFYPCVCTGSIKYIHQECLLEWLKYSKKEYCELCKHKYTFQPSEFSILFFTSSFFILQYTTPTCPLICRCASLPRDWVGKWDAPSSAG